MAVAEGAEPISLKEAERPRSTPIADAWRLFRRNKASLVALGTIITIVFIAITASLWTRLGLLDARTGVDAMHTINPVNQAQQDSYPDPGVCARDNQDRNPYWCGWLSGDALASVQDTYCFRDEPVADQLEGAAVDEQVGIVGDVAACGAEVDDAGCAPGLETVGFDVGHDVVPKTLLQRRSLRHVEMFEALPHLRKRLVRDRKPQLLLGLGEREPQPAPRRELERGREDATHLRRGVSLDQRVLVGVGGGSTAVVRHRCSLNC